VPAERKLSDDDVKRIRRRAGRGESLTALARELEVNRKTLRRRIDALNREEAEQAEEFAARRRWREAARERRKLLDRERGPMPKRPPGRPKREAPTDEPHREEGDYSLTKDSPSQALFEWLNRRKNLSGRAFAEARGLVRMRNSDGTVSGWFERAEVDAMLEDGWYLA